MTRSIVLIFAMMLLASFSMSTTLTLHRVPTSKNITEISARDRARYETTHSSVQGVVTFPLGGTLNPNILGLYYMKVQLGTPPRDYYVIVDTGSHTSWVSCITCMSCPKTTAIQNISINLYDPGNSSSAGFVNCNDKRCNEVPGSICSKKDYHCHYDVRYQEDTRASGYFVADLLTFTRVPFTTEFNTPITFGCTTTQTPGLMRPNRELDGLFGFGRQRSSIISQLALSGLSPWAFSHCLSGNGGGIFVFGAIVEPNIVYSPLVPSSNRYNLNLKYISVNGRRLKFPSTVFAKNRGATIDSGTSLAILPKKAYRALISAIDLAVSASPVQNYQYFDGHCYLITSRNRYNLNLKYISVNGRRLKFPSTVFAKNRGATIDSGTSLAIFPKKAYRALISAIDLAVSASPVQNYQYLDGHCYLVTSSITGIFPELSFNFHGGAAMRLGPADYLVQEYTDVGGEVWCLGFGESYDGLTVLGEIFMKNKFFIYDLAGERIGWTNYDCSASVNVTTDVNGTGRSVATRSSIPLASIFWSVTIVFLIIK